MIYIELHLQKSYQGTNTRMSVFFLALLVICKKMMGTTCALVRQTMQPTISEYSTRIILQSRIEGDTGGIFNCLPFQVSVLPDDNESPRRLATSCFTSFIFPLA